MTEIESPGKKSLPSRGEMLASIEEHLPEEGLRLRRLLDKEGLLQTGDVYGESQSARQVQICVDTVIKTEYVRARILELLKREELSVKQVAEALGTTAGEVLREVVELRRRNAVAIVRIVERTPYYRALNPYAEKHSRP